MKGLLGTKIGMTQIWKGDRAVPVTVVLAGPCPVVQRKTAQTDGYEAVQIGFAPKAERKVNRPAMGHFKKAGVSPVRFLREFRNFNPEGDTVNVDIFAEGEKIDATGTSKGKGFQGVIKRWHFAGGPGQPRYQEVASPSRFHRSAQDARSRVQGQENGRSHGDGPDHCPESGSGRGACRREPDSR